MEQQEGGHNYFQRKWIKNEMRVVPSVMLEEVAASSGNGEDIKGKYPVMHVDYIMKKSIYVKDLGGTERKRNITIGVKCHWWDEQDGKKVYRTGRFNTKELVPKDIYDAGGLVLENWLTFQAQQK